MTKLLFVICLMSVVWAAALASEASPSPDLEAGLTIPELVAELESHGYRDFEAVASDQRKIEVDVHAPDGGPVTLKYWPETGRTLQGPQHGDGAR